MRHLPLCLALLLALQAQAGNGRYLTWVDDEGRVHNTFVDGGYAELKQQAQRRIRLNARADDSATRWPGAQASGESKRRYFTWVDANGNLQSSFYAGAQRQSGADGYLLPDGSRSGDYIDADVLEGRGFVRSEYGNPYYTWVDEQGRMHNSTIPTEERAARLQAIGASQSIRFSEGREVRFEKRAPMLPGLDGQPTDAMRSLLAGSEERADGLYQSLLDQCCGQLAEDDFTELSADQPRYEELNRYSPSFDFPMGRSYYAALKLPRSGHTYGLRVRSFANQKLVYPSLLFLDEAKRPTRLVSDAVYQLHGETWYRYAFIEGTVPVKAGQGERYVLLLTTDEDRSLRTLDNQPFKRPLQDLEVDEAGMQTHAHVDEGGFELAIVR